MLDFIKIRGAREHNLKNINLDIPKNKLVVFTGVSGSGKSSLAFDTIYAEGQRRYVESLSSYARQFLGIMDKPDVDLIEGLSPSISIDQKSTSHNPRSTVGTITEIYDYLRLLFARVGHPHCPNCELEIKKLSLDEIVDRIVNEMLKYVQSDKTKPQQFQILSPVVRQKKGEFRDLFENIRSKGFDKVKVDKTLVDLNSNEINLIKTNKHSIEVICDSISLTNKDTNNKIFLANLRSRLTVSIEQAISLSDGLVLLVSSSKERLFSEKFSCPSCNLSLPEIEPRMFSFNSPIGACEKCKGLGTIFKIDKNLVLNNKLTINEGGILPFNKIYFQDSWYIRLIKQVAYEEGIELDKQIANLAQDKLDLLLSGTGKTYQVEGTNRFGRPTVIYEKFIGIIPEMERRFFDSQNDIDELELNRYMREEICNKCHGQRLKPEVLSITVDKRNIVEVTDESVDNLYQYFKNDLISKLSEYENAVAKMIIKEIITRLEFLNNVGLSYLTIARAAKTLSGGELQRIRLASQIGTGLTGVLYVLDEPSIGLHPKDVSALLTTLKNLRDLGNSIIVVEHDRETIENADWTVELGPRAGKKGGKLVFEGTLSQLKKSKESLTGQYLSGKRKIPVSDLQLLNKSGTLELKGASEYNLKKIDVRLPLGNLIAVTGVSGSGKSTLVVETLYPALKYYIDGYYQEKMGKFTSLLGYQYLDRVYLVDQSPIGRTPRSNPATYVGFFDTVREIYSETVDARAKGYKKGRFSFNVKGGRCEKCQGAGLIKIQMQFLPDVYVKCDVCKGQRYNQETLEVRYKGKNVYEILKMTVDEAAEFFKNHYQIYSKLYFLQNVGLGYIELGQPAPTFSGGEAQRIKLANELSKKNTGRTLYILDEPTTGLHFYDIEKLLTTLNQLVEKGNTVIVIEHNLDIIKNCQYIIDLGPDGGDKGGYVVYQGKIENIVKEKRSYTGSYLVNKSTG